MPIGQIISINGEEIKKALRREAQKKYRNTQKGRQAISRANKAYRERKKQQALENLLLGLFGQN